MSSLLPFARDTIASVGLRCAIGPSLDALRKRVPVRNLALFPEDKSMAEDSHGRLWEARELHVSPWERMGETAGMFRRDTAHGGSMEGRHWSSWYPCCCFCGCGGGGGRPLVL